MAHLSVQGHDIRLVAICQDLKVPILVHFSFLLEKLCYAGWDCFSFLDLAHFHGVDYLF